MEIHDNLHYTDSTYGNPERKWQMRSDHILKLFNLPPNGPIPPSYRAYKRIGNVKVLIRPQHQWWRIKRRVVAQCPKCFKVVCAGHLMQHMKVHNDRGTSKI
jgi:hypothetical protein